MVLKADTDSVRFGSLAVKQAVSERTAKADLRGLALRMRLQVCAFAVAVIGALAALALAPHLLDSLTAAIQADVTRARLKSATFPNLVYGNTPRPS